MKVSQVNLIETGDHTFSVSFIYESRNLVTNALSRGASVKEVHEAIRTVVEQWQEGRADKNFQELKKQLEVQSLEV